MVPVNRYRLCKSLFGRSSFTLPVATLMLTIDAAACQATMATDRETETAVFADSSFEPVPFSSMQS